MSSARWCDADGGGRREIDLYTAPKFRAQLSRAVQSRGSTVVLDLSPVTFFAAAGLTVLIEAQAEAEKAHRRMVLITKARPVDRVIDITGLSASLHRVGSLDVALASAPGQTLGCEATA